MMRKLTIILLVVIACITNAFSQTKYEYRYNSNGSRESRKIIILGREKEEPIEKQVVIDNIDGVTVQVFPNPTSGYLNLNFEGVNETDMHKITLYNSIGSALVSGTKKGNGEFPLDLSSYANGHYILLIEKGKEKLSYKIIKQ